MLPIGWVIACTSRRVSKRSTPIGYWSGRLAAAVHADRGAEALGLRPDDVEARVVEVLVANVLRRDHADQAELGHGAAQLGRGGRRIDHRQLGDRLDAVRGVTAELRLGVVDRPAQRDGEVAVEHRPLLAGAAGEDDR